MRSANRGGWVGGLAWGAAAGSLVAGCAGGGTTRNGATHVREAARDDAQTPSPETGWARLAADSGLDGWIKRGGEAVYRNEGGVIVGETRPNTDNTFLCTARDYADFELEFEVLVDAGLNSGVQIRSLSLPDYHNGRVFGYQVEIDPTDRAYSGGIYDEAARGWLAKPGDALIANPPFRPGEWNRYRIEAVGARFTTWINGVKVVELDDPLTPRGFIGLQVHSVGDRADPLRVRWRDIRIREVDAGSR